MRNVGRSESKLLTTAILCVGREHKDALMDSGPLQVVGLRSVDDRVEKWFERGGEVD